MSTSITRPTIRVEELLDGDFKVESFTDPGVFYTVDPASGTCTCPRYEYRGLCTKHVTIAEAIAFARTFDGYTIAVEKEILGLCTMLFTSNTTDLIEAFEEFLTVDRFQYSTLSMRREAKNKNLRVLAMHDCERGAN